MKKRGHSRRLLSVLLALVMLLSLLPTAVFAADPAPKATKITDASELKAGDQIILTATANSKTYAAGSLSSKYLTSIETDPTDPADKVEIFTLGGEAGAWTLTASDGKQIYTNAAKALNNTGSGTGTWTIAIDANGLATVASTNSACGRILYNVKSPRFLNYTSATNVSMLLPSIYRLEVSPARQSGIVTDLTTLRDGDKVVVFNPANGKTLSTEYTGHYNKGTDVTLADGKLEGFTDADKWTLGINDDGTYTFATADGKKLAMGTDFTSTPLDEVNRNWKITAVDGKDATFYIDNTGRTDKYRLQWFTSKGNWSAYTGTGDAFEQQIYLVVESGSETPDPEPGPTALIKDGKYVINRKFVGHDATYILRESGVQFSGDPVLVIADVDRYHPFVEVEMLMPVLGMVRVNNFDEALDEAFRAEHGCQHSAMIHSSNVHNMSRAARRMNTTIFVKNAPSYSGLGFGGEGYTTLTIATPTGEGLTSAKSFTRARRCVLKGDFRII